MRKVVAMALLVLTMASSAVAQPLEREAPQGLSVCRKGPQVIVSWLPTQHKIYGWVVYRSDIGSLGQVAPSDSPTWLDALPKPQGRYGYMVYVYYRPTEQRPLGTDWVYVDDSTCP